MKQCTHNKPKIGLLKLNLIPGSIILNIAINKSFEGVIIHHQENYFPKFITNLIILPVHAFEAPFQQNTL